MPQLVSLECLDGFNEKRKVKNSDINTSLGINNGKRIGSKYL